MHISGGGHHIVGTLKKDGYVRNIPLPRVPQEQRASPELNAPKDRIQLPGYSQLPAWIPTLPKLSNVLEFTLSPLLSPHSPPPPVHTNHVSNLLLS